jgi:hypothetical protein
MAGARFVHDALEQHSDQLSLPSRRPPDSSTPTTMTANNTNHNRPLHTRVHLRTDSVGPSLLCATASTKLGRPLRDVRDARSAHGEAVVSRAGAQTSVSRPLRQLRPRRLGRPLHRGSSGPLSYPPRRDLRKSPATVEDLGSRPVHADRVVPAIREGKAIRPVVLAAAEIDRDRPVVVSDRRDVVGVAVVGLKEPLGVVRRDRPETVDGNVADVDAVLAHGKPRLRPLESQAPWASGSAQTAPIQRALPARSRHPLRFRVRHVPWEPDRGGRRCCTEA